MTDDQLVKSIAQGDREAFEELYRCYHGRLARYLTRRIPTKSHSVGEMINDTFMVVWQRAGNFRNQSRVSTWIFGIAHRVALKSLRRDRRWLMIPADGLPSSVIDPNGDIEQWDWLAEGLRRLSNKQRLSVLLAYQLGHSIDQVAALTESPAGTVKARLFHARGKLRGHLTALR
jgi:RNA polymerase sigma-70 factor (ECF subfamily)